MTLPEILYYIGYSLDKRYKLKHQKRLPHKVISIGNITVGGTGKTPATIAIAEEAKKRGFSPVVLTRGYRGKAKGPCFVKAVTSNEYKGSNKLQATSNEYNYKNNSSLNKLVTYNSSLVTAFKDSSLVTRHSSLFFGDEPVLMVKRLKDVPIVKCFDRYKGGVFALSSLHRSNTPFLFILDDGFQHWKLHRDIDIVLIDGLNPFGNGKMLPMGPLREPLNELKRADIFVVTKTPLQSPLDKGGIRGVLSDKLKGINPEAPVYFSEYRIHKVRDMDDNEYPIEILKDKKVYAFCGIANPDSFRQTVLSISGDLVGFKRYRDHCRYSQKDVTYLARQAREFGSDFLLTTEKDMVKIKEIQNSKFKIQIDNALCLEIDFSIEPEFFDEVFKNIPP